MSLKSHTDHSKNQSSEQTSSLRIKQPQTNKLHLLHVLASLMCLVCVIFMQGCAEMNLASSLAMPSLDKMAFNASKSDKKNSFDEFDLDTPDKIEPPYLSEYVTVSGLNMIILEGVGLVTGLDGTGGDPPPSQYRTLLLKDMQRRNIPHANQILESPATALVIVRAYLPPLVQPGDKFDVEVRVPEGSETTSLNSGRLLECSLTERAVVAGKGVIKGKERSRAAGPILVSTGEGKSKTLLRRGRIVGGGVGMETRDMRLYLKNDFRSVRNATRIASRIGKRFFSYNRYGHREPLAKAMTDQKVILKIHPAYKENFPRYVQVIQNIAFRETEVEQQVRMEHLEEELMVPESSELAAVQLEAIGNDSIPILKRGLKAKTLESRFHAAVALAYLGEPNGLEVLYIAARDEPAFRVFALAAMSTIDDGETHIFLSQLMDEPLMEIRYGAFRGLTTIDKNDPLVRGETLNDQCKLHLIDTPGKPMIHLTHHQKAEMVLFGADQKFSTPLAISAGPHISINAAAGSDEVIVSRFQLGKKDQRVIVSNKIADVIRAAAKQDASYPDIAQMLIQAERQLNLPGQIGIDMLPEAGRVYNRPANENDGQKSRSSKKKMGRSNLAPNQFTKMNTDEKETVKPILTRESMSEQNLEESPDDKNEKLETEDSNNKKKKSNKPRQGSLYFQPKENSGEDSSDKKTRIKAETKKKPFYKRFNPVTKTAKLLTPEKNGEILYPEPPPPQQ